MHTKFFVLTLSLIIIAISANCQTDWSLQQCINYALEQNIQIKQQKLTAAYTKSQLTQTRMRTLPSVNAGANQSWNYGRTVDPFTNDFTESTTQSVNMSISASWTLFNGFQTINTIRENHFNLMASIQDIEKTKNDICLNIAAAYLQILFSEELVEIAKNQLDIMKLQIERTEKLVNAGALPKGNLLDINAQFAADELQLINAENQVRSAYLTLSQLLELDSINNFKIAHPIIKEPDSNYIFPLVENVYFAAQNLPQIRSSEYKVSSSEKQLLVARGGVSPKLILSANAGTGFSDARKKYELIQQSPSPIGYVGNTGETVLAPSFSQSELDYAFSDQLKDNKSYYLTLGLNIPIFNNWMVNSNISYAKINLENSKYQLELTKKILYKEIQLAHNDAITAQARYIASKKAVAAMEESFNYTQQKFDLGLLNSVDYNTVKNNLIKAKSDLLQAKYEFIFKTNILNFYMGEPIKI